MQLTNPSTKNAVIYMFLFQSYLALTVNCVYRNDAYEFFDKFELLEKVLNL